MANDVKDHSNQGRYRGFDVDDGDENNMLDENNDSDDEYPPSTACTCSSNSQIESLKKIIREQTAKIEKLEKELSQINKNSDNTTKKKRKREDELEDVFNAEITANSTDKDILIKELTDENENLKQRALGAQHRKTPRHSWRTKQSKREESYRSRQPLCLKKPDHQLS